MDILASKVVDSVLSKYSSLQSYIDEAVVETTYNQGLESEWTSKVLLRTVFKSPNLFRFDRRIGLKAKESSVVVWFDGRYGYISDSSRNGQNASGLFAAFKDHEARIKDCLNHCFVFSGFVNTILHPLFFSYLHQHCELRRENWTCDLLPESYVLRIPALSIQVERESLLISQIVNYRANATISDSTTITAQRLNEEVDLSLFDRRLIWRELKANQVLSDFRERGGKIDGRGAL